MLISKHKDVYIEMVRKINIIANKDHNQYVTKHYGLAKKIKYYWS